MERSAQFPSCRAVSLPHRHLHRAMAVRRGSCASLLGSLSRSTTIIGKMWLAVLAWRLGLALLLHSGEAGGPAAWQDVWCNSGLPACRSACLDRLLPLSPGHLGLAQLLVASLPLALYLAAVAHRRPWKAKTTRSCHHHHHHHHHEDHDESENDEDEDDEEDYERDVHLDKYGQFSVPSEGGSEKRGVAVASRGPGRAAGAYITVGAHGHNSGRSSSSSSGCLAARLKMEPPHRQNALNATGRRGAGHQGPHGARRRRSGGEGCGALTGPGSLCAYVLQVSLSALLDAALLCAQLYLYAPLLPVGPRFTCGAAAHFLHHGPAGPHVQTWDPTVCGGGHVECTVGRPHDKSLALMGPLGLSGLALCLNLADLLLCLRLWLGGHSGPPERGTRPSGLRGLGEISATSGHTEEMQEKTEEKPGVAAFAGPGNASLGEIKRDHGPPGSDFLGPPYRVAPKAPHDVYPWLSPSDVVCAALEPAAIGVDEPRFPRKPSAWV